MNTIVLETSNVSEDVQMDVFSKLMQNRVLFIDNLVDDRVAMDIVAALLFLDRQNQEKITLFINADGGEIRNVMTIYDSMRLTASPIETFCIGCAMRETVLILAAGTKGYRYIGKNADICVAQVISPYATMSDLTNTKISHDKNIKDNNNFMKELSKVTGKPLKELKQDTQRHFFLTPSQAVAYGIVDKVA